MFPIREQIRKEENLAFQNIAYHVERQDGEKRKQTIKKTYGSETIEPSSRKQAGRTTDYLHKVWWGRYSHKVGNVGDSTLWQSNRKQYTAKQGISY